MVLYCMVLWHPVALNSPQSGCITSCLILPGCQVSRIKETESEMFLQTGTALTLRHIEAEKNAAIPVWGHSRCPGHCLVFGLRATGGSQPAED